MIIKKQYEALFLNNVRNFIQALPNEDQGKIKGAVTAMESGDFRSIYVKTLKTPIKELIVRKYRFTFFILQTTIYFLGAFIKKTVKTPKKEIEYAEKTYKMIISR